MVSGSRESGGLVNSAVSFQSNFPTFLSVDLPQPAAESFLVDWLNFYWPAGLKVITLQVLIDHCFIPMSDDKRPLCDEQGLNNKQTVVTLDTEQPDSSWSYLILYKLLLILTSTDCEK